MSTCLQDLYDQIERDIDGELPSLIDGGDADRFIHESLDAVIPSDTGSLAELLNNHNELAGVEDGALNENPTVWDIIQHATYEKVREHANSYLEEKKEEFEELKDELEGEGYQTGYELPRTSPRSIYLYKEVDKSLYPRGWALNLEDKDHPSLYEGELFIKGGFKNDHEAWTWLEKNLEEVQAKEKEL